MNGTQNEQSKSYQFQQNNRNTKANYYKIICTFIARSKLARSKQNQRRGRLHATRMTTQQNEKTDAFSNLV